MKNIASLLVFSVLIFCCLVLLEIPTQFSTSSLVNSQSTQELSKTMEYKVAILGDQGLGEHPLAVLKMIRRWGASALLHLGDFDYSDNPNAFIKQLERGLGRRFPILAVVGNHDVLKWYEPDGYRDKLVSSLHKSGWHRYCRGEYGVSMVCVINDIVIVASGIATLGSNHTQFVHESFTKHAKVPWKICMFHKNMNKLQTGSKPNESGYPIYETCREHGAMIFTAHDHSYERTHLLSNFTSQTISSTNNTLHLRPGHSFVALSGLGGDSIRYWENNNNLNPWWAATAALDNGANYGALLCKFNHKGKKHHTRCIFKDIDGQEWDRFDIVL